MLLCPAVWPPVVVRQKRKVGVKQKQRRQRDIRMLRWGENIYIQKTKIGNKMLAAEK